MWYRLKCWLWYRLKCWLWKRHTTVKPRYLPHTWVDRDELLAHLMFEVLSQYVEKEADQIDWNWNEEHRLARQTMQEIYDWWHKEYNSDRLEKLWEELPSPIEFFKPLPSGMFDIDPTFKSEEEKQKYNAIKIEIRALEQNLEDTKKEMMHKLVDISRYLWS